MVPRLWSGLSSFLHSISYFADVIACHLILSKQFAVALNQENTGTYF